MKKIIKIIAFILLFLNIAYPQDTNTVKFFPLKVGNIWVYQNINSGQWCNLISKRRIKVISSININVHKYFLFSDTTRMISGGGPACYDYGSIIFDTLRIDSINGNIYKYSYQGCSFSINELIQDSIKSQLHDTIELNCGNDREYICFDTTSHTIFGRMLQYRTFEHWCFENYCYTRSFAKTIGEVYYSGGFMNGGNQATLLGCFIDGVLSGDTTFITGLFPISTEIPKSFSIYQNYPNPFNPSTKIKFSIPQMESPLYERGAGGFITLKIYDILGREVATPVNEKLNPGTYEVEWDGSNFASGVYFYKLEVSDPESGSGFIYSSTRRMVLLK